MADNAKILIVDDEPLIRDALAFKLGKEGYHVATAEDGEQAIQIIDREQFDIIISDIMMPYVSGFELLRILKERELDAPVLLLTSLNSPNASDKAFSMGADGYITKPFSPNELSRQIKDLLAGKKVNR